MIEITEKIEEKGSYDILVAGGGVAGVAAALAAARAGKSVLLIEKSINLGGLATIGLINLFVPMCNGRGTQIIRGMADEFLREAMAYGWDTLPDEWKNGDPGEGAKTRLASRYSAPIFSLVLLQMLEKAGVSLLLDTVISRPVMEGGICRGLIVENKSGREYYTGRMVIDTTGDADVLYRAGVPTVQGQNYFTSCVHGATLASCQSAAEHGDIRYLEVGFSGGKASLYGTNHPAGMRTYTGTTAQDVTEFVIKNQNALFYEIREQDRKSRDLTHLPAMPQYRTTRRIDGDYTLTVEDRYRHFDDSVSAICDFDNRDYLYEVPLRTLTRRGFDNLITAGRCAAGESYAWDILRVIPPAIVTGQAAGEAAALALDTQTPIWNVEISALQQRLRDAGVMIHFDDALIPEKHTERRPEDDIGHI